MCFGVPTAEGPPFVLDMNANMLKDRSKLSRGIGDISRFCFQEFGNAIYVVVLGGYFGGHGDA